MPTKIGIVDGNNFYVSCERVFQPRLVDRPVVVLSNNDGCAIARSNEAKALGIEMGAPWHLNRDLWDRQGVIVRSSNYELYGDLSRRVVEVLRRFAPRVEVYSIDESFVDLDGFGARLEAHAREIRSETRRLTGIPVSIGIGPTKTLAKIANKAAKKDPAAEGVRILSDDAAQIQALGRIGLTDLWGVKDRLAARFAEIGVRTPLDLRSIDARIVRERMGVVAERIALELRGVSAIGFDQGEADRKSIVVSKSFGRPIEHLQEMREAIVTYMSRAAEKMRQQGLATATFQVFLTTNPFRMDDRQRNASRTIELPVATADTGTLCGAAVAGIEAIWKDGYRYKKTGVMLLELVKAERVGGGLFDPPDSPASKSRMRAMDTINRRFGRGTMIVAGALPSRARARAGGPPPTDKPWTMRRDVMSRRFTTRLDEILEIGESSTSIEGIQMPHLPGD